MKEKLPLTPMPNPSVSLAAEASETDLTRPEEAIGRHEALAMPYAEHTTELAIEPGKTPKMRAQDVDVFYGDKQALRGVSIDIHDDRVTAFIGPSGCGKSTFLRCLNRMNDTIPTARVTGVIELDGRDISDPRMDVVQLRARVGMVFQQPNPFPKSIYENVA